MKKIYHLSGCTTCKRIIKQVNTNNEFTLQDIKTEPLTAEQLEAMHQVTGSYESLFSRKSMKYRAMGLHEQKLSEKDYRRLILEEYTFLKRPVIVIDEEIFVGNDSKTIEAAKKANEQSGF
jgi:arsenate reductase (glutaredoxin)